MSELVAFLAIREVVSRAINLSSTRNSGMYQNYNAGLFMQQTGLSSREVTLYAAGAWAIGHSANARLDQPHGLDPTTEAWISAGYAAGVGGVYGHATGR
jgi:hypothetical protein